MKNSLRRGTLISVVAAALVAGGFFLLVYMPVQTACAEMRSEIEAAEIEISKIPARVAELEHLRQKVEVREAFLREHEGRLPRQADLHDLVRRVSDLARNAGLQVTRLEPLQIERRKTYQVLPFRVSLRGQFSKMTAFLSGLERLPRLLTLEELSLSRENRQSNATLTGEVRFSVYARYAEFTKIAEIDDSPDQ